MRVPESDREPRGGVPRGPTESSDGGAAPAAPAAATPSRRGGLPPALGRLIAEFRSRARVRTLLAVSLSSLLAFVAAYLAVFLLERWFDTPAALRATLAAAAAAVAAIGFPQWIARWWLGLARDEQVARRLGRRDLAAGDRLLGAIDLARGGGDSAFGRSPRLVAAAIAQVEHDLGARDLSGALPPPRHRRLARAAALPVLLAILTAILWPAASANSLARLPGLFSPPRYTFARITELPAEWVVPRAEPLLLEVALAPESRLEPAEATLRIAGVGALTVPREEGMYRFEIPPRSAEGSLSLRVGDLVQTLHLRPVDRPELVELEARVGLPAYLGIAETIVVDLRGGGMTAVEGSAIALAARATRPLARALLDGEPAGVQGDRIESAPRRFDRDRSHTLAWEDEYGLAGARPARFALRARPDAPPTVSIRDLPREVVALASETLSFRIEAGDDFGVAEVGLRYEGVPERVRNPEPSVGEKRVAVGAAEARTLGASATFCAARLGIPPQTIELRATARDALPGREASLSTPFTVHVLSEEEHMVWLTGELGRWLREASEVRDRERDLHRANQELRALGAEELDRPEARQRLEEQAIAERANGSRLARLGERGEELLARAARNPEFNASTMDEWAERVRSLKEIAEERIPSVSDLLARASSAREGAPPSGARGGEELAAGESSSAEPDPSADGGERPEDAGTTGDEPRGGGEPSASALAQGSAPTPGEIPVGERGSSGSAPPPAAEGVEPASREEEAELARLRRERETGPGVRNGEPPPSAGGAAGKSPDTPPAPGISDQESTLGAPKGSAPAAGAAGGSGGAGLVTTTVPSATACPPGAPATEAEERLEDAIREQSELLARFDEALDELAAVLRNLEGSTFVKRLKEASREQTRVAGALADVVGGGFGRAKGSVERGHLSRLEESAALEWSSSERMTRIQGDLDAFVQRTQRATHQRVLDQMKETAVTAELNEAARAVERNHGGDTIARAELWADTLDRWADELVGPG